MRTTLLLAIIRVLKERVACKLRESVSAELKSTTERSSQPASTLVKMHHKIETKTEEGRYNKKGRLDNNNEYI